MANDKIIQDLRRKRAELLTNIRVSNPHWADDFERVEKAIAALDTKAPNATEYAGMDRIDAIVRYLSKVGSANQKQMFDALKAGGMNFDPFQNKSAGKKDEEARFSYSLSRLLHSYSELLTVDRGIYRLIKR